MSVTVQVTETSTAVSTTENVAVLDTALEDVTVATTTTSTSVSVAPLLIQGLTTVAETDLSFTDITTANATTSKHGLMPKLTGSTTTFFRSDGTQAAPTGANSHIFNVLDYGAVGNGITDDSAAIQAALNACETNQGGDVYFPITSGGGRYKLASGVSTSIQGTRLIGQGHPGTASNQAKGSTQIVVANGITGITFNPGASPTHQVRGYAMENLHVVSASGATTGNGVLVQNCERFLARDVTCSDFVAGYGLKIDGTAVSGANAQYAELLNYSGGDCLYGLWTANAGPNGLTIVGGYFAGGAGGTTPAAGSKAIYLQKGDTARLFGVKVQGYETAVHIDPVSLVDPTDVELYGFRSEFNNYGVRVGQYARGVYVDGGCFDNFLLTGGGSNIGIDVHPAASGVYLNNPTFSSVTTHVNDPGRGVQYATYAAAALVDFATDTFTDTAGTALPSHTMTLGGPWITHGSYNNNGVITDANRLRPNSTSLAFAYYTTADPTNADYVVQADITNFSANGHAGIAGRMATGADTMYFFRYNGSNTTWELYKLVAGSATLLGTGSGLGALGVGSTATARLTFSGTSIVASVDGVQAVSVTDSSISAKGKAGIRGSGAASGATNSTGLHIDNFHASL